jgi:hypothetical protein
LQKFGVDLLQRSVSNARLNTWNVGNSIHAQHQIALSEGPSFLGVGSACALQITTCTSAATMVTVTFFKREISGREIGNASKQRLLAHHVLSANWPKRILPATALIEQNGRGASLESMVPTIVRDAVALRARFDKIDSDWNPCHGCLIFPLGNFIALQRQSLLEQ